MNRQRFSPRAIRLANNPMASAWEVQNRAAAMAAVGTDIIFLSVGDPDFATPSIITERAFEFAKAGRTKYSPAPGEPALRAAVARKFTSDGAVAASPDQVTIFPGAQNALFNVMMCIAAEGDDVIVPEPLYATYPGVVAAVGANLVMAPTDRDKGFAVDVAAIGARLTAKTTAVLLNSPGNPTGAIISRASMADLVSLCKAFDLWLISDEVYANLVHDGAHIGLWEFAEGWDRAVVLGSMSKTYAMSGWRMGWAVGPDDLSCRLAELAAAELFGSPQFIQDTCAWVLDKDVAEADRMRRTYKERRDYFVSRINAIDGLSCRSPAGGMFVMIDIRVLTTDCVVFAMELLESEHLAVIPGCSFGPSALGHLRVSLTQPISVLGHAADALARFSAHWSADRSSQMA